MAEGLQERSGAPVQSLPRHLAGFEDRELQLFFKGGNWQVQRLEAAATEVKQNRVSLPVKTAVKY